VTACTNTGIRAGSVQFKADSVILNFDTTQRNSLRRFRFSGFNGTADRANAYWAGGTCEALPAEALCEGGTAVWHR
jgi:hypothetical protein